MRVHQIHCPKCDTTLKSKAGILVGQSVSCPKCRHKFAVREEPDSEAVEEEDDIEERTPARRKGPPPRRQAAGDDEDDEDERPRKKKPVSARKGRDRDDDDEDDDRPRRKNKGRRRDADEPQSLYRRLRQNVAVRVITLVVLLSILAVLAYLLYEKKMAERELDNSAFDVPAFAFAPDRPESTSTGTPD